VNSFERVEAVVVGIVFAVAQMRALVKVMIEWARMHIDLVGVVG
jgi:hypothetical protein